MVVELSLLPVRGTAVLAGARSTALSLVRQSGLAHTLSATGVRVEGEDEAIWALLWQIHKAVGDDLGLVVTETCMVRAQPVESEHALRA